MVTVYINDIELEIEEGKTVLEASEKAGIDIPTIWALPGFLWIEV